MAYSDKTTNYELPIYVATDKPKYLTDFNGAMQKIDTAIKGVADSVAGATTNASNALEKATSAETTANGADTKATSAQTQATTNHNILASFFDGFNDIDSWLPNK